jgi:MFS family permease
MQKENSWKKYPVLFSLYIAQSVPMSFFSTVIPVIMRQENFSLESIGLLQLVKLPWIIKFLWAPFIDSTARTSGALKKWIILSECFYAVVIISIAFLDLQTDFSLIVLLMVVAFTASATQDIATDAFAIMVLKKKERGFGNSMQAAGSFIGALIGTGVLLIAYTYFGWSVFLYMLAGFVLIALLPLQFYRKKYTIEAGSEKRISPLEIIRYFQVPGIWKRNLLLMLYYSGFIGILTMLKPWLVDLGYSIKQIGLMSGIVGTSVATVCALLAGWVIKRAGRKNTLMIFLGLSTSTGFFFWNLAAGIPSLTAIYIGICLLWGAYGASSVIIYTTSMDTVRPGKAATDFTIQIVITHLSSMIVAVVSGKIAGAIGYRGLFGIETILGACTFLLVWLILSNNIQHAHLKEATGKI